MSNQKMATVYAQQTIESIFATFDKMKIKDSNQRLISEIYLEFLKRVRQLYSIDWLVDKYQIRMERKLDKYRRIDRCLLRKIRPKIHRVSELHGLLQISQNLEISGNNFCDLLITLQGVVAAIANNIMDLKSRSDDFDYLCEDLVWINVVVSNIKGRVDEYLEYLC